MTERHDLVVAADAMDTAPAPEQRESSEQASSRRGWDYARKKAFADFWNDGNTSTACEIKFGMSRSAACARVARMRAEGWKMRAGEPPSGKLQRRSASTKRAQMYAWKPAVPVKLPSGGSAALAKPCFDAEPYESSVEELVIPLAERKQIETLTETCCRWPIGDPQRADFHFCGRKKVVGRSYCEFHVRRARQPTGARGRMH